MTSCGIITTVIKATWILEQTQNDRFPYHLQILRRDKPWLTLRAQDKWPTAGRHIFCLREDESPAPNEILGVCLSNRQVTQKFAWKEMLQESNDTALMAIYGRLTKNLHDRGVIVRAR